MRTYSKPSASVELFCLDSEFAGGCNKIEKPFSVEENFVIGMAEAMLSEYQLIKAGKLDPDASMDIQDLIRYNEDINSYDDLQPHLEAGDSVFLRGAWENAQVVLHNQGAITDNLTSGYCYFTFTAPLNKTFS